MIFDNLFQLMAEKKASDLFITAGAPIHIKIQGHTMPINQQVMDPLMIQRMLGEAITPAQTAVLERDRELNLSFGRRDLGNFRVNVFWQRNSPAGVCTASCQAASSPSGKAQGAARRASL
mgnify:CR=1 FL=1